eukprot:scaffold1729_cov123-Chaetoceros_neogracile.AAC.1
MRPRSCDYEDYYRELDFLVEVEVMDVAPSMAMVATCQRGQHTFQVEEEYVPVESFDYTAPQCLAPSQPSPMSTDVRLGNKKSYCSSSVFEIYCKTSLIFR